MTAPHVVFVEDQTETIQGTLKLLKRSIEGLHVSRFETAREFLDAMGTLEAEPPHVFVLDLFLPWDRVENPSGPRAAAAYDKFSGGTSLAKEIRSRSAFSETPIVFFTAARQSVGDIRALEPAWAVSKLRPDQVLQLLSSLISVQVQVTSPRKGIVEKITDALE